MEIPDSGHPRHSLAFCILLPILASLAVNGVIFALRLDSLGRGDAPLGGLLPGTAVGLIWTILFGALGAAWWEVSRHDNPRDARRWLLALLLFCIAYPLYTLGFTSWPMVLFGNIASIPLAAVTAWRVARISRRAALAPAAVCLWVSVATWLMLRPPVLS